jgi:glycosyltransferase involved in cell wall biosynthesis
MTQPVVIATDGVFPHALGGIQRHARLLVEELARRRRVALTVLHPHDTQVFDPSLGIEEVRLPGPPGRRHYLRELHAYSRHVHDAVMTRPRHVVYAQGMSAWADAADFGPRLIVNPHGLEFYQAFGLVARLQAAPYRLAHRGIFGAAARVVSLGGRLTGIARAHVPDGARRVVVLPNATAPPGPPPPRGPIGAPVKALYVGRLAWNKGIDVLVDAARLLEERGGGYAFTVVGDGPRRAVVAPRAPGSVTFLGALTDDARLRELYRTHDVFVLPTLFEGMPTVVLEAMAHALPVVVTDVGATRDMVDASNGFIVKTRDAGDTVRALVAFRELDDAARAALAAASYRRVTERFTWPIVAERHEELFLEVAREAGLDRMPG